MLPAHLRTQYLVLLWPNLHALILVRLPQIMAKLALQDGDHISLESVRLPKGEYVQMRPQSASWIDIPMAVREAMYYLLRPLLWSSLLLFCSLLTID
jgi:hypothetical protein